MTKGKLIELLLKSEAPDDTIILIDAGKTGYDWVPSDVQYMNADITEAGIYVCTDGQDACLLVTQRDHNEQGPF